MADFIDLRYVCTNLGNLSGLPVRLYEGDALALFYSIVNLPIDPFARFERAARAIEQHVGYYITPHDCYYGIVNAKGRRIVIGPTREIPLSDQELHEIAFEHNLPYAAVPAFIAQMRCITPMPLTRVLQMLCFVNHVLNDGEALSLPDISILEPQQRTLMQTLGEEAARHTLATIDENAPTPLRHNTKDIEAYMLGAVTAGDVVRLREFFANVPAIRSGIMAGDDIRQSKNLFVVTATLVSRAAMRGGMEAEDALTLSDRYIQKCELLSGIESITNLNYRMVIDYAERVALLREGGNAPLVMECNNYIRRHLSETITVENMARALCRGRSRLSSDFKRETGENLSTYILRRKIEESKQLLLYTDKPAVDIAYYLGFSSQSHFTRIFKQLVGQTPHAYRRSKDIG